VLRLSVFLEQKGFALPTSEVGRAVGAAWERTLGRTVVRRLVVPAGTRVVTVGGATLGGSGKTPLAIACAAELARDNEGLRVVLVGHAYRGAPGRARVVSPADPLADVGDEALLAARELDRAPAARGSSARVVVGPARQAAMDLAARLADVIVVDGVAQIAPARAALSLLAVDADEPWGRAAAVPPWGDLRAPVDALLAVADHVVAVGGGEGDAAASVPGALLARALGRGAWAGERLIPWDSLRTMRVGLLCALARPDRVERSLARRGVRAVTVLRGPDHGPLTAAAVGAGRRREPHPGVEVWLATPKCALHATDLAPSALGAPLAVLEHALGLPPALAAALTAVAQGNTLETSRNVSQNAAGATQMSPRGWRGVRGRGRGQHA
jgi:tetraacyldisaccharide-1-P 4'-kinase